MADKTFQVLFKKCGCCGSVKVLGDFYPAKTKQGKPTISYKCKACAKIYAKKWADNNRDKTRKATAAWYAKNKAHASEYDKKWRLENKDRKIAQIKRWAEKNPEKVKQYRDRGNAKVRSTIKGRINDAFSSAIYRSLRGDKGGRHWEKLVGYTIEDLKKHIEKQFKDGMSWDNYGKYTWHIDHKIPVAVFNIVSPECLDFKRCWALSNLQPLWAKENHSKHSKISAPFQPSLPLEVING